MNLTNIKGLCSAIAFREGKKTSARIGEIREIVSILSDIMYENGDVETLLWENGEDRHHKKNTPAPAPKTKKLQMKTAPRKFKLSKSKT